MYWMGEDAMPREEARLAGLSFTSQEKADLEEHFLAVREPSKTSGSSWPRDHFALSFRRTTASRGSVPIGG